MTLDCLKVELVFGKSGLSVFISEKASRIDIFNTKDIKAEKNLFVKYKRKLFDFLNNHKGFKSVCIVIPDHTRACPTMELLSPLLKILACREIKILIGTGTHRNSTKEEMTEMIPSDYLAFASSHDYKDENNLVQVGVIDEIPIKLNKQYVNSDLKIAIGLIEPHFMAGFSGGRKAIIPGISGWEAIAYSHGNKILASERTKTGNLRKNPFHDFITRAVSLCSPTYCINALIDRNRKPIDVFCGSMKETLKSGSGFYSRKQAVEIRNLYDVVISGCGGYPLDATLYQGIKGLVTAAGLCRNGGKIYFFLEGSEGFGSERFASFFSKHYDWESLDSIFSEEKKVELDQWQIQLLKKYASGKQVIICSDYLCETVFPPLEFLDTKSAKELIENEKGSIAVIPEGPYTFFKLL
ncbi:MAG: nickel-dependent lactate racemase [Candidatus Coatesbacteria bacterium]|nr:nickel-dependent lactate racemase [Candidatus Coatesbacteria bacterium]